MRPVLPRPIITTAPASESPHDFGRHVVISGEFEHGRSCNPGFTRVDSLLPQINITKQSLRKIEAVHLTGYRGSRRATSL